MKQIGFKNFRRFENFPMLNLGDVTILVGRNNAGKSTMVKALLLLLDNLKERVPHGEKHLFHFDLSQEHNTHVNTFKRALCSKSNDSNMLFEATFASNLKKSYSVDSDEGANFTISLTVEGDRTRDISTGEITFIRISDNIKKDVFEFDLGVKRMRLIFGDTANAKSHSHEEGLSIEELKAALAEARKRGDIEDIARLTADIQKLKSVRKKKPTKSDSTIVETDLEIKTFEPWAGVANYIYAFVDYYSRLEYKKTKKRGLSKADQNNYSMLNGTIVGIEQFAVSVATTLVETKIEYIYAHAASQKVLFSIDDKNDYLAKTLHEFYKANVESGDTAHRFLKYWLGEFGIGEDINVETIEGEGYTAEIMCQDGFGRHLADLGTGSVQLVILLLKLATLVKKYGGTHLDLSEEERERMGYYGPTDWDYEGAKPIVIIEEPEQNLHPAIQSKLAELFYEVSSKYGIRFIIETHSEYLIRRSQVIVAENNDEKWENPFAVYYFQDNDIPYAMAYRKDGKFSNEFGTGFFDEASNLAFKIF